MQIKGSETTYSWTIEFYKNKKLKKLEMIKANSLNTAGRLVFFPSGLIFKIVISEYEYYEYNQLGNIIRRISREENLSLTYYPTGEINIASIGNTYLEFRKNGLLAELSDRNERVMCELLGSIETYEDTSFVYNYFANGDLKSVTDRTNNNLFSFWQNQQLKKVRNGNVTLQWGKNGAKSYGSWVNDEGETVEVSLNSDGDIRYYNVGEAQMICWEHTSIVKEIKYNNQLPNRRYSYRLDGKLDAFYENGRRKIQVNYETGMLTYKNKNNDDIRCDIVDYGKLCMDEMLADNTELPELLLPENIYDLSPFDSVTELPI